jgi:hypothetical protein
MATNIMATIIFRVSIIYYKFYFSIINSPVK